jgi:hypothetical protein
VYVSHGKAAQQRLLPFMEQLRYQNSQENHVSFRTSNFQQFYLKLMALKEQLSQKTYKNHRTAKKAGLLPAQKSLELILRLCFRK